MGNIVPQKETPDLQYRMGVTIKAHRLRLGVTQEELAWRANIHRSYLADIERGGRNVTLQSIANLARALEVSVTDLLHLTEVAVKGAEVRNVNGGEILLVEDNAEDAALALRAFRRAKFANPIKLVTDGQAALDFLFRTGRYQKRQPTLPQLVLLDLNLPKVSGVEVLRAIKSSELTRNIPVVVLTVALQDELILECSRLGAENYIIKPLGFENFSKTTPALDLQWALVGPAATRT
ncbi:MAG: response regulator [Lacunisphaera sp.]|nr:response regulator [Lacunisphaera sp.]